MKILIISLILILHSAFSLKANDNLCKKFDIVCKAKKSLNATKEFQKKEWSKGKNQLGGSIADGVDNVKKAIPKKK